MMNKQLPGIAIHCLFVLLMSCNDKQPKASSIAGKDTMVIWADTSLRVLVNEQKKAFENTYTNPLLDIHYLQESLIVEKLMKNEANCAILQRKLTPNESAYLKDKEDFLPKQYVIASDAFAFVTSTKNTRENIATEQIHDYFRSGKAQDFQLVFESNQCQAIPYFQNQFQLDKQQIGSAFVLKNLNELLNYLRTVPNAVGIIPFSYISDTEAATTLALLKDLKVLSVAYKDSSKISHLINPSQESITTGDYPFVMPIVLMNCNFEKKSGITFVNYIMKPKAQRLFLKCGMVPAIFPAREVHVNTN